MPDIYVIDGALSILVLVVLAVIGVAGIVWDWWRGRK